MSLGSNLFAVSGNFFNGFSIFFLRPLKDLVIQKMPESLVIFSYMRERSVPCLRLMVYLMAVWPWVKLPWTPRVCEMQVSPPPPSAPGYPANVWSWHGYLKKNSLIVIWESHALSLCWDLHFRGFQCSPPALVIIIFHWPTWWACLQLRYPSWPRAAGAVPYLYPWPLLRHITFLIFS